MGKKASPSVPDELNDRPADNWDPLLAIADLAGGDWPARARKAAIELSRDADAASETVGVQGLFPSVTYSPALRLRS